MKVVLVLSSGERFRVEDVATNDQLFQNPHDVHHFHGIAAFPHYPLGSYLFGQPKPGTKVRVNGTHVAYWYAEET